ncbi:MAG: hypothetical protein V7756_07160 [Halopseudomonas sp.]|uniref:hypothetical protein n=1 Tax=Halopseudomonas sp. TaxID=2901191 RepID=UPI0030013EF9
MKDSLTRAETLREAIANFKPSPYGISVLRSKILTSTIGTDLDGMKICDTFAPVGVNNPDYRKDLSGLGIIVRLMEVDPSLYSALVFSRLVIADELGDKIISSLKQNLPQGVDLGDVLTDSYKRYLLGKDLGL